MIGTYICTLVLTDHLTAFHERPDLRLSYTGPDGRHGVGTAWIGYVNMPTPFIDARRRDDAAERWGYCENAVRLNDDDLLDWLVEYELLSMYDRIALPINKPSRYNQLLFCCSRLLFRHYGVYGSLQSVWVLIPDSRYNHDMTQRVTRRRFL